MTTSKLISYYRFCDDLEKFSYVAEIPYSFWIRHSDRIECWIDENNRDFYCWYVSLALALDNIVIVAFANPADCFDFKIAWGH